jgi:serine/threonine protein kinase/WD40 repeat protein
MEANADRLIELFHEAKASAARGDLERFLHESCKGEPELRAQILSLLEAHQEVGDFLGSPAAHLPSEALAGNPDDKLGHYRLLGQIGEGGCGVVYLAEQEHPVRRQVALKVIKLGMDTKSVVARFEAERQALALMDHPNIAKVLDAGATAAGRPYFVMELVRGIRITDFCDQHLLPTRERLKLFRQVCQAVQHAHQKGIIHRDLKPSNVLVSMQEGTPTPKIIDFGIAKATSGQPLTDMTLFTAVEQFLGTPAYMSPEQAEVSGIDIDTRSDIYSLGVLLYELLTGHTPFDAKKLLESGMDSLRQTIREKDPPRPSTRLAALREADRVRVARQRRADPPRLIHLLKSDLDWIVMKCLEKDRTRRYETANGLAMDLHRYLTNEPILAHPPSTFYRLQKLIRRNAGAWIAALAVVLTLAVAVVGLAASHARITREKEQKDAALAERTAALAAARASEQRSLHSQAKALRHSGRLGQRFDSLAALAQAARIRRTEELRDDAIASLALPDIRRGPTWERPPNVAFYNFDRDYRRLAYADHAGVIRIQSFPEGQDIQRIDPEEATDPGVDRMCRLYFSPNGQYLANAENGRGLEIWRVQDKLLEGRCVLKTCSIPAFSPDSRQVAVGGGNRILLFDLDLDRPRETRTWEVDAQVQSLAFHPRLARLAVGYRTPHPVSVLDTTDGRTLAELPVGALSEQLVAWHPDGRRLAVAGTEPDIQIWDTQNRHRLAVLKGHAQNVTSVSFHPDGGLLASWSWDGSLRLWDPASGRQVLRVPLPLYSISFSQDGHRLGVIFVQGRAQVLEIDPAREYRTLVNGSGAGRGGYFYGDISPDGRLLALGMEDGVRLWDLVADMELAFLDIGRTHCALFPANGRSLLTCGTASGLQQWPILEPEPSPVQFRLGPPQRIPLPFAPDHASLSRDRGTLGLIDNAEEHALVLNLAEITAPCQQLEHPNGGFVAHSADGRWLATSGWHSEKVRLWRTDSAALVKEWTTGRSTMVFFTPDSRTLVISCGDEFSFWDVPIGREQFRIRRDIALFPSHVAFAPDGKLMALEMAPGVVHLKEVATGHTVAKLEDPFHDRATWLAFTPSGTQLVVVAGYDSAIHLWDLRTIRDRLKAIDLDWSWPDFPSPDK